MRRVYTGQKKRYADVKVQIITDDRKVRMELKIPKKLIRLNEKVVIEDDFFTIEFTCTKWCEVPYLIIPIYRRLSEDMIKGLKKNKSKRMTYEFDQDFVYGKVVVTAHMLLADAFASTDEPLKVVDECTKSSESEQAKHLIYHMVKYNTKCNFTLTIPRNVMRRTRNGKLELKDDDLLDVSIIFKKYFNLNRDFSVSFDMLYSEKEKYDVPYVLLKSKKVKIENDYYIMEISVGKDLYRATDWTNPEPLMPREKNVIIRYKGSKFLPKSAYGGLRN